ncbi:hypothetical protein [Sodalis glossinidius]|nr:hypothetical protein [Sodalis glossinidius]
MAAGPVGFAAALTLSAAELTSGLLAIAAGMLDRQHPHAASVLSLCSLGIALAASGIGEAAAAKEALTVESAGFAPRPIYHLNASEMGLYTNYANRRILAFQTHGAPTGALLQDPGGQLVSAATIAREYIQPLLNVAMEIEQQVFSPNEPLLLLACYGSRSGTAREVANVLCRPVAAYDNVLYTIKAIFAEGWMGSDVMPRYQVIHNPLRRLWLHISGQPMLQSASYQMVYPDGFDAMQQGTLSAINNFERHYYGLN